MIKRGVRQSIRKKLEESRVERRRDQPRRRVMQERYNLVIHRRDISKMSGASKIKGNDVYGAINIVLRMMLRILYTILKSVPS